MQPTILAKARRSLAGQENARLHLADALAGSTWETICPDGGFDCVVGNPPYVRHEAIRDPLGRLTPADYKRSLAEHLRRRLGPFAPQIDGRSDLSALFTLLSLSLLKPSGALGLVLPAALLDARYGAAIEATLESTGRSALAIESATTRSFSAAVNTVLLLVLPVSSPGIAPEVAAPLGGATARCPALPQPTPTIQRLRLSRSTASLDPLTLWNHLRHPQPATWLPAPRQIPTVPLSALGRVRYPIKTGLNAFFYLSRDAIARFGLEPDVLVPVLKSPREVRSIAVDPAEVRTWLFACPHTLEELNHLGHTGALAYIRWAERQRTPAGIPWPAVRSLRHRRPWYAQPLPAPADILIPRFVDRRHLVVVPSGPLVEDQTFYGLVLEDGSIRDLLSALLNSSLGALALETHGRSGLGDGVRQYALCDAAALPIPDPRSIPAVLVPPILEAYRSVSARTLLATPEEMKQLDRLRLDAAVGEALRLSPATMAGISQETLDRLKRRHTRARSVRG